MAAGEHAGFAGQMRRFYWHFAHLPELMYTTFPFRFTCAGYGPTLSSDQKVGDTKREIKLGMFVDRKPFIYLWRPFYRGLYAPVLQPFLVRLLLGGTTKRMDLTDAYAQSQFAPINQHSMNIEQQQQWLCNAILELNQRTAALTDGILALETETKAQWMALEQLLLSMISDPATPTASAEAFPQGASSQPFERTRSAP
jgi:hypothetical protein